MTTARSPLPKTLRLLALAVAMFGAAAAHADEYGDVNQLLRSGRHAEALTKADQYLAGKPKDPQMRFLKGVIQSESGRAPDAITTFTRLTEDFPELPEPYNNLAVLYAGQSQFDKARAALEMAIRTNPSYATAHENLGDVYAKLASQAYSRALQLDSTNSGVQPKLALIRDLFTPGPKGSVRATGPAVAAAPVPPPVPAARPAAPAPAVAAAAPAAVPAPVPAPGAISPAPVPPVAAPAAASAAGGASKDVESAVNAWAAAWAAKDMNGYLAAYGKEFDPPGKMSRKAWEDERRSRIVGKSRISVKLSDMQVSVNGDKAVAKFRQAYSADSLNVSSRKTLEMVRSGGRWQIVRESTG
ncbi:L,D-transpeptidase Cds6 family protein [Ramlibacter sp.]|uniref:L,D-transpeptidase Cds6 family protein n=1 Tax=Ramlibacter sp. TaxID=1917967 RepID=UPI003D0A3200